jgi:imidazolonepropionase-like amidohydrolase
MHAALTRSMCALVLLLVSAAAAPAQERPIAIRGARIHTIAAGVIEEGTLVIRGGKIADVGRAVTPPADATILDAKGLQVTPGLIDARSSVGVARNDAWETSGPIAPQLRIVESFLLPPNHDWLREGVTTVYITPGPEDVLGGMGATVKLAGSRAEQLVNDTSGMSASLGEIPKRSFGTNAPRTRMGAVALLRAALIRAQEYARDSRQESFAGRDVGMEALGRVLRREVPLRVQANTADDIMNAVRIGKEFEIRVVIDCGVAAYRVAPSLAAAGVPVVVGPNIIGAGDGGRFEFKDHTETNAARLQRAGVAIALSTDDDGGRSVAMEAAIARAHGLPAEAALEAVTLSAAKILGVADRLGSIEKNKDADIVLWKGEPLRTWSRTEKVIVNGRIVFERTEPRTGTTVSQR